MLEAAAECRERWGCPGREGHTLEPDLAAEAKYVAALTRTPEATTCPLACVTHSSPWVVELTEAVALASEWHVPLETTLGRDLAAVDIRALAALKNAQYDAWQSDQKIREQEAENERQQRPRGGGAR